jgi:MFS family permease
MPVPLRHNRDFTLLWSGELVSTLGSQTSLVAFPLLVLALTGSPAKAGLVGFARTVPALLFYLPAGVLVDRHDRRMLMVASNATGAFALGSIPVALALGHLPFAQIMVVAFLQGSVGSLFSLTEQGALPLVVEPSQVPDALASNGARRTTASLVGPQLGGLPFGIDRLLPFVADALSYLVSAVSLLFLRTPLQEIRAATPLRLLADIAEGVRALRALTFVRASALAVAAANLIWSGLNRPGACSPPP